MKVIHNPTKDQLQEYFYEKEDRPWTVLKSKRYMAKEKDQ